MEIFHMEIFHRLFLNYDWNFIGSFLTPPETMAARITASAVDFAAVGAKIPAAQKAVICYPISII